MLHSRHEIEIVSGTSHPTTIVVGARSVVYLETTTDRIMEVFGVDGFYGTP